MSSQNANASTDQRKRKCIMSSKLRSLTLGAALLALGISLVRSRTRTRRHVFKR
jgi:hypothetical protein